MKFMPGIRLVICNDRLPTGFEAFEMGRVLVTAWGDTWLLVNVNDGCRTYKRIDLRKEDEGEKDESN